MILESLVWSRRAQVAFLAMGVSLWASCGSDDSADGSSGGQSSCVPGQQLECTCEGGEAGTQTCNSDGSQFSQCECAGGPSTCGNGTVDADEQCDDGNTDANDGCSPKCNNEFCGDGIVQPGEDCDDGNSVEFDMCPQDCQMGGSGGNGGAGGSGPPSCEDIVVLAGMTAPTGSVWSKDATVGLDAGQELCDDVAFGSHVCTYDEVLIAEGKGELANVPDGTAWLHRTTPVMVMGNMTDPGPYARCNNFEYGTDHLADGEFIEFASGTPTYNFDPTPGSNEPTAGLPCSGDQGGPQRVILCCNPCQD